VIIDVVFLSGDFIPVFFGDDRRIPTMDVDHTDGRLERGKWDVCHQKLWMKRQGKEL